MTRLAPALFAALLLSACHPPSRPTFISSQTPNEKLSFLPERAEKGNAFRYYQPQAASKRRSNWTSRFDLSGISWNDSRTATLIAPSYVVMAGHFPRPSNVPVMFHDPSGNPHERYITATRTLNVGDIAVGRLNRPLPPEVKRYRFAPPSLATPGQPVIVTDQTMTLSVHRLEQVIGGSVRFSYFPELDPTYHRNLVFGDSGNPSFLISGSELLLLETHTTGSPGAGPNYSDPTVQAAIRTAMAEMEN